MRVLAVCTGNICRSPAVEWFLGSSALAADGVDIESAGTDAMVGAGIHPDTATALNARGAMVKEFAARSVTPDLLTKADLIIALSREQRSRLVQIAPVVLRRSYTLAELARIADRIESAEALGEDPSDRLATLLRLAPSLRTAAQSPEDDDVDDPISGPPRAHEAAVAAIEGFVDRILRVLV